MAVALRLEKGPAALRRCRIIFVWGPNSPLAALILWRETTKFVIARRPKADVAILQYPAESWESDRQKRSCLPEIATAPLGPRNDKSGNLAPRNHYCNTCNCQWRSMSALQGGNTYGTNSLAQCHQVCHCEEAAGRRGNLAVPDQITGKPSAKTQLPSRDCTPRALPRASRSGRHGPFGASQ